MIQVILERVGECDGQTYGVLKIGQNRIAATPRFVTCEDVWWQNTVAASCIPTGEYRCVAHNSPKFGSTYLVTGVPGRSHILFHAGNNHGDTTGCILVGSSFAFSNGSHGIIDSGIAFLRFMKLLTGVKEFDFLVRDLTK